MKLLNWQSYLIAAAIGALIAGSAAGFAAWNWQANKYEAQLAAKDTKYATDLKAVSDAATASAKDALKRMEADGRTIADLDAKLIKVNNDAKLETDRLKRDVDAGNKRLRIKGTCPAAGSGGMPPEIGTASDGDATTVELAAEARQDYYDLRTGIKSDQAALITLQKYVTEVCLQ